MKKQIVLNPNCSEAVFRIRIDKMTKKQVDDLYLELHNRAENISDKPIKEQIADTLNEEYNEEDEWYETSVFKEDIFGVPLIVISGDVPFNNAEKIWEILDKHKVNHDWVEIKED